MLHDIVLKKLNFYSLTPRVRGGMWGNICYHASSFRDFNKVGLYHDLVLKKLNFDLLTPSPRVLERWRVLLAKHLLPCCSIL